MYYAHIVLDNMFLRVYDRNAVTPKDTPMTFIVSYYIVNIAFQLYFVGAALVLLFVFDKSMMNPCIICADKDIEMYLLKPMLFYQLWTTVTCMQSADLNHGSAMFHHIVSLMLTYVVLKERLFYSQAILYAGLFEISSVFLNIYNLSKILQIHEKEEYKGYIKYVQLCFAVSFLIIRNGMLPIVSYGPIKQLIGAFPYMNPLILIGWVLLTGFQYFWGFILLRKLHNLVILFRCTT